MKTKIIFLCLFVSISVYLSADTLVFSQDFLKNEPIKLQIPKKNRNDILDNSKKYLNHDFNFLFSLGGGARFYYDFVQAEPIINADLGFRTSEHFALISGAEFWFHKYTSNEEKDFGAKRTTLYTSIFISPSYFLNTKHFMFSGGGGLGWSSLLEIYGFHIFSLIRGGYKFSKFTSLNFSVRVPMYTSYRIDGLSASAIYSILF